ncbi:G-protein coupled receptor Mth2 [Plutella xylostella]|uniref:G-protein coupled receptor Mth2 n=1 Tax=Plutella xylostella TaxID=51655 RepID=UPI0020330343|nr:G-protein coupled receptor Mth2 [Plutella xylostella]
MSNACGTRYRKSAGKSPYQPPPPPQPAVPARPPSEMHVSARAPLLLAIALALASAHLASHDNILRIQLWDEEGLTKVDSKNDAEPTRRPVSRKSRVQLESLYQAMVEEEFGGRFTRHRVRHKRRRARGSGPARWRFHDGDRPLNVAEYEEDPPSAVSERAPVNETQEVPAPLTLRQEDDENKPVVQKCCAIGQNISFAGDGRRVCAPSMLTFQPIFYQANDSHIWGSDSHMWRYDSNDVQTIVGFPACSYDRFKLDPSENSEDEFYLLRNGSIFAPYQLPPLKETGDYCMETFWSELNPAGITLPLICFSTPPIDEAGTSLTLIFYAVGLLISVPFLLATACVYTLIRELRDTHGKALACHSVSLATAFSCLAATQLAGHAFPTLVCSVMAYLIQFSFVSCFFWLNVMCFDTLLNVRRNINNSPSRRSMRIRFVYYCLYAVLLPVILLIVTITMELSPSVPNTFLKPNFGVKGCWFKNDQAALPYFYGPVALILCANLIIFFLTSRTIATHYDKLKDVTALEMTHSDFSTSDDWVRLGAALGETLTRSASPQDRPLSSAQRLGKYRKIFRTCCVLTVIMGLSWVMEVVSWAVGAGSEAVSVWSVFDVINALQGVVIFAIFVMQQPVRSFVKWSKLCSMCRIRSGSEVAVVSERTSIDCGTGRRDYV